jgi:hypothetical protein
LAAGLTTLVIAEISAAAHYLPLSPFAFGLIILGPLYGLTSLFYNFGAGKELKDSLFEPGLAVLLIWSTAAFV